MELRLLEEISIRVPCLSWHPVKMGNGTKAYFTVLLVELAMEQIHKRLSSLTRPGIFSERL